MKSIFGDLCIIPINKMIFFDTHIEGITQDPEVERYYKYLGDNKYKFTYEYTYYLGY
jgi:hypothetical protein